jgi:hypothetical protein
VTTRRYLLIYPVVHDALFEIRLGRVTPHCPPWLHLNAMNQPLLPKRMTLCVGERVRSA